VILSFHKSILSHFLKLKQFYRILSNSQWYSFWGHATVILDLMDSEDYWEGTYKELLEKLDEIAGQKKVNHKAWPSSARKLSSDLDRIKPNLRTKNIHVEYKRHTNKGNVIALKKIVKRCSTSSPPSSSSDKPLESRDLHDDDSSEHVGEDDSTTDPEQLPSHLSEEFQERAAIGEFDGKLEKPDAERQAMQDINKK